MTGRRSLLVERFERVCRDRSSSVALHALVEHRTVTFADLWREYEACWRAIGALGLPPGSAILSLAGNRVAFVPCLLAARELGLVPAPVDSVPTGFELERLLRAFEPSGVVAPAGVDVPGMEPGAVLPGGLALHTRSGGSGEPAFHRAEVLKLTSGSAGVPKAVACSEANLVADGEHIVDAMGIRPDDVNVAAIPLSHSYGIGNLVMPLLLQGTAAVLRQSFVPDQFVADVSTHAATVFPGVPYMYDHLLQRCTGLALPPSLRLLLTAGARIRFDTVAGFERAFGLKVHSFYGTSETGGITFDDTATIDEALPVGRPLSGTTVTVRGEGPGPGLVHVRGAAVAAGYVSGGAEAEPGFVDGGFLTGDLGRFEDGALILTGRVSRFLNVAGRKVDPEEIERVLLELPEVDTAQVFGLASEKRGEAIVACLVPAPGFPICLPAIREHCSRRLSPHKIPRQFVVTDALPVGPRGKVDRRALEALVQSRGQGPDDPHGGAR